MTHADIIARLTAATGPDRELEIDLMAALGYRVHGYGDRTTDFWKDGAGHIILGNLTASVDACLALIERIVGEDAALQIIADVANEMAADTVHGTIRGIPRELLLELFRALEAQEAV